MKVTEYFVGFGPRLWSFRRGETEYGIKALPLRRLREDPGHDQPRGGGSGRRGPPYRDKPFHSRLLVAVAGSAMHFLLAFVLLWVLLAFVGVPDSEPGADPGAQSGGRPDQPGGRGGRSAR